MLVIDVPNDSPNLSLRATLDTQDYIIELEWNERESRWYMGVQDTQGVYIVSRVKVVANWPLGRGTGDSRMWPGLLMALDTSGLGVDPGFDEWGGRVLLTYVPEAGL